MLDEHQSAESRSSATMDESYAYPGHTAVLPRDHWRDGVPAQLFRYRVIKRCMDILCVLLALPVLLPLFGVIAIVMMRTSPGPILFSHRRIRKNGAFFSMWKFRTMCVNSTEVLDSYLKLHPEARAEWYATRKLRVDPRVTAIGAFLRRFSLDELPQVWNVLMGTMSLVGPRPIVAAEVEKYGNGFQCYCRVKPGLTGLWQVSGRSELSYDARVALDCAYVKRWSLGRDIVILMKTFAAVVHQDGAF
ncbi:sugar transferase [Granulicella arctica]|uniref:sugar transferase n=1 Tax=Granulicella arctica TaxID=940613 RepID=UPI0021E084DE|nr:sugar transferase [Granulicella arctica]